MAIAFRAASTIASGLSTSRSPAKPTGTVDDDIVIGELYIETTQDPVTGLTTTGFTAEQDQYNATALEHHSIIRYHRAAGDAGSYTWSWTSNLFNEISMFTYSGCIRAGSPINASSKNSGSGTTATLTGVTTTVANCMLLGIVTDSAGSTYTFPGGWTPRTVGDSTGTAMQEKLQAAVGATGNFSVTLGTSGPWTAILVALTPEPLGPLIGGKLPEGMLLGRLVR